MAQNNIDFLSSKKDHFIIIPSTYVESVKPQKRKEKYSFYKTEIVRRELLYELNLNNFKGDLEKGDTFNEITELGKIRFSSKKIYLFKRLTELKNLFDIEGDGEISLDSLKSMLFFFFSIKNLKMPIITLNDSGFFQANWKKDRNNLLTTVFIDNWSLNYVIFRPGKYTSERIILNGVMPVLDFRDYLLEIDIKLHREKHENNQ